MCQRQKKNLTTRSVPISLSCFFIYFFSFSPLFRFPPPSPSPPSLMQLEEKKRQLGKEKHEASAAAAGTVYTWLGWQQEYVSRYINKKLNLGFKPPARSCACTRSSTHTAGEGGGRRGMKPLSVSSSSSPSSSSSYSQCVTSEKEQRSFTFLTRRPEGDRDFAHSVLPSIRPFAYIQSLLQTFNSLI